MTVTCPPAEVVSFILETVSFSGASGQSLTELWQTVAPKLAEEVLPEGTKQMIWQWLFFSQNEIQLYLLSSNGSVLEILPEYSEMVESVADGENQIRVLPNPDTQWRYLTGLRPNKKVRNHMGEKPFEMLVAIASHGANGVTSSDLCKETGQDPRSLPVRFKKLTDMGLIIRKRFYDRKSKQQTNLSIHTKFVPQKTERSMKSDDAIRERNTTRFKELLMERLRLAPNKIRGFRDLKVELGMAEGMAPQKFFGAMVNYLTRRGFVEKCLVKLDPDAEDSRQLYCIRMIKELPKTDTYELDAHFDEEAEGDVDALGIDEEPVFDPSVLPCLNNCFPLANQIYAQIDRLTPDGQGVPAKEIIRNLTGLSGFRPYARILDQLSGYVINEKQVLAPLKPKPDDPYDEMAIMRSYDFDGKYKFYRYYTRKSLPYAPVDVQPYKKLSAKQKGEVPKKLSTSLASIEAQLGKPLTKAPSGAFLTASKKRRGTSSPSTPNKKRKLTPKQEQSQIEEELALAAALSAQKRAEEDAATAEALMDLDDDTPVAGRRRKRQTKRESVSKAPIMYVDDNDDSGEDFVYDAAADVVDEDEYDEGVSDEEEDDDEVDEEDEDDDDEKHGDKQKKPVIASEGKSKKQEAVEEEGDDLMRDVVSMMKRRSKTPTPTPKKASKKSSVKSMSKGVTQVSNSSSAPSPTPAAPEDTPSSSTKAFTPQVDTKTLRAFQKVANGALDTETRRHSPVMIGSLRGLKRQEALLELLKEQGGAQFTSAKFRRDLDSKLNSTTAIDNKTLARDISVLVASGKLEVKDVSVPAKEAAPAGAAAPNSRKLLILVEGRPDDCYIEELTSQSYVRPEITGRGKFPERQVVSQKVTLYTAEESDRVTAGKERLDRIAEKRRITSEKREKRMEDSKAKRMEKGHTRGLTLSNKQRKPRRKNNITRDEANVLYRAVVICRSFLPSGIDFEAIADIFSGHKTLHGPDAARSVWIKVRSQFGGLKAVMRGQEEFQKIVMDKISEGLVTTEDLELGVNNLPFFLDLWNDVITAAPETEDDFDESAPLFATRAENDDHYGLMKTPNYVAKDIVEMLDDNSMRYKEQTLANITFSLRKPQPLPMDADDDVRTAIKAIYSIPEAEFVAQDAKRILSKLGDSRLERVTKKMIEDKQLLYLDDEAATQRFQLLDRVRAPVNLKHMNSTTLKQAAAFEEQLNDVFANNKGLVVSEAINNGSMITLLSKVSTNNIGVIHIDRSYQFEGYESRALDKSSLACDMVLIPKSGEENQGLNHVPVPIGQIGHHVWLDLKGAIKPDLWRRIITAVVYHICFRPGILPQSLYAKLSPLLGNNDFIDVMSWLEHTNVVEQGRYNGYWLNPTWYRILGS